MKPAALSGKRRSFAVRYLESSAGRNAPCLFNGMTLSLILLAMQVVVAVVVLVREKGEDVRFAGDKLGYRS